MKIRNGFVSNSSSSSFYTVWIPDDFDFDCHMEYNINKFKKFDDYIREWHMKYIRRVKEQDFINFIENESIEEDDDKWLFNGLEYFLRDFIVSSKDLYVDEGHDIMETTRRASKKEKEKLEKLVRDNNEKYKDIVKRKKEKKEEIKKITLDIDPYAEEDWMDEFEGYKLKKFDEL